MTYSYTCTHCKANWEAEQKITDLPLTICPKCGEESAKRLISGAPGIQLKGGGWASEGYSGPSNK